MHQLHATHRVVTQILDKLEFTQLLLRQSGGGSVWSHTSNDDWSPKTHKKGFCVYFEIWAFAWPSIILVLQQSRVFDILRGLLCSDQLRSTCNIHILHFCCRIIWKKECIFFSFFHRRTQSLRLYILKPSLFTSIQGPTTTASTILKLLISGPYENFFPFPQYI